MFERKRLPYPHGNFAETNDLLEELALVLSGEKGRVPIPEQAYGFEELAVRYGQLVSIRPPQLAVSADIYFEADKPGQQRIMRYKVNGSPPEINSGFWSNDGDKLTLYGRDNLTKFRVIGADRSSAHFLRIQYFKTAQQVEGRHEPPRDPKDDRRI